MLFGHMKLLPFPKPSSSNFERRGMRVAQAGGEHLLWHITLPSVFDDISSRRSPQLPTQLNYGIPEIMHAATCIMLADPSRLPETVFGSHQDCVHSALLVWLRYLQNSHTHNPSHDDLALALRRLALWILYISRNQFAFYTFETQREIHQTMESAVPPGPRSTWNVYGSLFLVYFAMSTQFRHQEHMRRNSWQWILSQFNDLYGALEELDASAFSQSLFPDNIKIIDGLYASIIQDFWPEFFFQLNDNHSGVNFRVPSFMIPFRKRPSPQVLIELEHRQLLKLEIMRSFSWSFWAFGMSTPAQSEFFGRLSRTQLPKSSPKLINSMFQTLTVFQQGSHPARVLYRDDYSSILVDICRLGNARPQMREAVNSVRLVMDSLSTRCAPSDWSNLFSNLNLYWG